MDAFCHHSMLYQTHHHHHPPFLFQFPSTTPLFLSSSPHQEMECVEAAAALSPKAILDANNNGVSSDDFSVDDLFDFTNEEDFLEQQQLEDVVKVQQQQEGEEDEASSQKRQKLSHEQHFSDETTNFDYSNISTDELAVPADDVANLEWLSHFVEDSFSEHSSAAYPGGGMLTVKPMLPQPEKPATTTCFETPVPGKARSKRTRTGGRVWSRVTSSVTESSSSSSLSSSSSSLSASSSTPWLLCSTYEPVETEPASVEKKKKIQKKRPAPTESNGGSLTQPTRRCSHCGVTKTPQWRAGPMGAKTLCNACGVRFKSGRLFPEYRPACSPTFSTELHSNHHRKVIEMRRKKEGLNQTEPGLASTAVPSF